MASLVSLLLACSLFSSSSAHQARSAFRARGRRADVRLTDDRDFPTTPNSEKDAKLATAIGLTGLAGGATMTATTIATTAGGVCAGGACAVGASALVGSTGGAAATVATGGGLLAGAKALVVGGTLLAAGALNGLMGAPTLESMVAASTPLEIAIGSGRPTVMEFYGNACPHCHDAARQLRSVEETAIRSLGFNWVMINTDDPSLAPVWNMYHVDELPHFEFFNAQGDEVGFEVGQVQAQRIEERLKQAAGSTVS